MKMFLGDLLQRALGEAGGIAPRRASRFEPEGDAVEPAVLETVAAPVPARERDPFPPPLIERRTETIVREFAGQQAAALESRLLAPAPPPAVIEKFTGLVAAPSAPVPQPRPEYVSPRREVSSPAPFQPPGQVAQSVNAPAGRHTATIIHDRLETRAETRTIERRLESLVREVERTRETRNEVVRTAPAPAPPAAPVVASARTFIVPTETARRAPEAPLLLDAPAPAAEPVVHVTIGRVEIRASAPAAAQAKQRPREPRLSLEDYLRKREGA